MINFHHNKLSLMLISSVGIHGQTPLQQFSCIFVQVILSHYMQSLELYIPLAFIIQRLNVRGILMWKYFSSMMDTKFGPLIFQDPGLLVTREGIFSWEYVVLFKQGGFAAPQQKYAMTFDHSSAQRMAEGPPNGS